MDVTMGEMMQMQRDLYAKHEGEWSPLEPEFGKDSILYMMEEVGEVIAIVKKKGGQQILSYGEVRQAFLEEMADVLMYYHEVLLRFHVTPEEISKAYQDKHDRNMTRNYQKQYEEMLHDGQE